MTLIKSISGTRGTIGGRPSDNFTAQDIAESTAAYAQWLKEQGGKGTVVIGRDGRISGEAVSLLVCGTLRMMGFDVLDLGLSTTPTVEIAVAEEQAAGGIIITASHNPKQWNALKFLNDKGEFISETDGQRILAIVKDQAAEYAKVEELGGYEQRADYIQIHIEKILLLPYVNVGAIRARNFKVVVDCVNSTGAISIIPLLQNLGCEVVGLFDTIDGNFAHNPEPLAENLIELCTAVKFHKADLGIAVDPDVDRLVMVCEDGEMFGEEYTLVAVADYVLSLKAGNTVSNLSSTQALRKVTEKRGGKHFATAVGEVNVVAEMKNCQAVIGGEGNGGIILPDLHYGRDALVGIALFLSHLAAYGKSASFLRSSYPNYHISKNKIQLTAEIKPAEILEKLKAQYKQYEQNSVDGLKIYFGEEEWVHLRQSNTEPIIRIYAESSSENTANNLAQKIMSDISEAMKNN